MLIVYSKNNCPYCVKAKKYLELKGIPYQEINIQNDIDAKSFILSEGHTTVPQIYLNNELFVDGGCNGLLNLSEEELFEKLK